MKKVLFVDLDDTLFQSHGKCPVATELVPLAYLSDGNPISYASPAQMTTLQMLQTEMLVVPVTARNLDAFSRVRISFTNGAVLNYGGVILKPDMSVDEVWMERSRSHSSREMEGLQFYLEYLKFESDRCKCDLKVRIIEDLGLSFYVVAKSSSGDAEAIAKIAKLCERQRQASNFSEYRIHVNGNNLAVLPNWLDKRNAVQYLQETLCEAQGPLVTFGMGDSLIDIGFMSECQYMIVPTASQIAAKRLVDI